MPSPIDADAGTSATARDLTLATLRRANTAWTATQRPTDAAAKTAALRDSASTLSAHATSVLVAGQKHHDVGVSRDRLADALGAMLLAMDTVAHEYGIDLADTVAECFNERARRAGQSGSPELRLPKKTGARSRRYDEPRWTRRLDELPDDEGGGH